ncbi:MAG: PLP-dependent aminotransferase family protein [Clostridia bacterium]|nr:PLP-dependent aminotransferase family protein [Clostridia bacterium]
MTQHPQKTSLYKALYASLKADILSGVLSDGEKLPSKRAMAEEKQVSVITVMNAYEQLLAEGYIRSDERRGYFVSYTGDKQTAAPALSPAHSPPPCRYDFKSASTAAEGFPFSTWARLMREVLTEKDVKLLSAIDPKGVWELRCQIAKQLSVLRGLRCEPGQIIIGAGSEYLLGLLYQLLGRRGYALETPGFSKAAKIYDKLGADVTLVPADSEGINMSRVSASPGIDVVHVTPSHSFPTGTVTSMRRREQLLDWVAADPARRIVEDDFDSEFRYSGRALPSLYSLDRSDRVVYMNTFTRTLAPSLRIGYMVLPPALLTEFEENFLFYSSTVPALEQHVLARFIADGSYERHINRMRKLYRQRRDTLIDAVKRELGDLAEIVGREAGVHLLLRLRGGLTERAVIEAAREESILLAGLHEYTSGSDIGEEALVMNFAGLNENEIRTAISLLAARIRKGTLSEK